MAPVLNRGGGLIREITTMQTVKGVTKEQFEAFKASIKSALPDIGLIVKRRNTGAMDIYPRVSKDYSLNHWNRADAERIHNFVTSSGLVDTAGRIHLVSTRNYEGIYLNG